MARDEFSKAFSLRFNLKNDTERMLWEKLTSFDKGIYKTKTNYVHAILGEYFRKEDNHKKALEQQELLACVDETIKQTLDGAISIQEVKEIVDGAFQKNLMLINFLQSQMLVGGNSEQVSNVTSLEVPVSEAPKVIPEGLMSKIQNWNDEEE